MTQWACHQPDMEPHQTGVVLAVEILWDGDGICSTAQASSRADSVKTGELGSTARCDGGAPFGSSSSRRLPPSAFRAQLRHLRANRQSSSRTSPRASWVLWELHIDAPSACVYLLQPARQCDGFNAATSSVMPQHRDIFGRGLTASFNALPIITCLRPHLSPLSR